MEIEKIKNIIVEFESVEKDLSDPAIVSDQKRMIELGRKRSQLEPKKDLAQAYLNAYNTKIESEEILKNESDPDMKELAEMEFAQSKEQMDELEEKLKMALLPSDPNDTKNVIIEIRAGAGGDEAALFGAELGRAYIRFAESLGYKTEFLEKTDTENGGAKEWIFKIEGDGAYSKFKYESGVHRVQRVPETESQGRVHTSTCSVAVLPEAEEVDFELDMNDLRIDVYRSSGNGGQSVNTTDSAVRITHIPTGIVVTCQDGKSQHKNKASALSVLRSRLQQIEDEKAQKESSEARLSQIGSGDRSEKIRTYNFPQSRITDHRIKKSWSDIHGIMAGEMGKMMEEIALEDATAKLEKLA